MARCAGVEEHGNCQAGDKRVPRPTTDVVGADTARERFASLRSTVHDKSTPGASRGRKANGALVVGRVAERTRSWVGCPMR